MAGVIVVKRRPAAANVGAGIKSRIIARYLVRAPSASWPVGVVAAAGSFFIRLIRLGH